VAVSARPSERKLVARTNVKVGLDLEQPLGDPQVAATARPTKRIFVVRANVDVGLDPEQPLGGPQVAIDARVLERSFVVRANVNVGLGPEQPLRDPQVAVLTRFVKRILGVILGVRANSGVRVVMDRALCVRQSPLCAHLYKLFGGCHDILLGAAGGMLCSVACQNPNHFLFRNVKG